MYGEGSIEILLYEIAYERVVLELKKTARTVFITVSVILSTSLALAVTHICHERSKTNLRCLVEIVLACIWVFVSFLVKWTRHFTLGPRRIVYIGFDNGPVGINTLNQILPNMNSDAEKKKKKKKKTK